ncbi:MCE family protein [bacterium]|nr:MCE family protein [bacterium]
MPSRVSRGSLIFVGFILACVALMVVIILTDRTRGLTYVMTFQDAKGLNVGAPVMLRGTTIGEVVGVRLADEPKEHVEVAVRIYPEHRNRIPAPPNSTGRIKKDSLVLGSPFVEIVMRGDDRSTPMPEGMTVEGLDSWADEKLWAGEGKLKAGYEKALEMGKGGLAKLEDWSNSEQGQKIRAEVDEFFTKLDEVSSDSAEVAKAKLSEAVQKGSELMAELKKQKAGDVAQEFRKSMEGIIDETEGLKSDVRQRLKNMLDELPSGQDDEGQLATEAGS